MAHRTTLHGESSDFTFPINDFLICQHGAELRAPVHRFVRNISETDAVRIRSSVGRDRLCLVCERVHPGIVKLEKDPLRPFEILGIGRADFAGPVVAEAERLKLSAEVVDIALGGDARMLAGLDRILLGGKTKGIPAHRMQHIVTLEAVITGKDIGGGVSLNMADMQTVTTRIRKHIEHEIFLRPRPEIRISGIGRTEDLCADPMLLPAGFKFRERIVLAGKGHLVRSGVLYGKRKRRFRQVADDNSFGHPQQAQDPRDSDHAQ